MPISPIYWCDNKYMVRHALGGASSGDSVEHLVSIPTVDGLGSPKLVLCGIRLQNTGTDVSTVNLHDVTGTTTATADLKLQYIVGLGRTNADGATSDLHEENHPQTIHLTEEHFPSNHGANAFTSGITVELAEGDNAANTVEVHLIYKLHG